MQRKRDLGPRCATYPSYENGNTLKNALGYVVPGKRRACIFRISVNRFQRIMHERGVWGAGGNLTGQSNELPNELHFRIRWIAEESPMNRRTEGNLFYQNPLSVNSAKFSLLSLYAVIGVNCRTYRMSVSSDSSLWFWWVISALGPVKPDTKKQAQLYCSRQPKDTCMVIYSISTNSYWIFK